MEKLIKKGYDMEYGSFQYNQMIVLKNKYNFEYEFLDESIIDFYADSNLGGAKINIGVSGCSFLYRPFLNDLRIKNIEFELTLRSGYLSWLEIWKTIDDFIIEYEINCVTIQMLDIYEKELFFGEKQIHIVPFLSQ
jgi:hypothetical protein